MKKHIAKAFIKGRITLLGATIGMMKLGYNKTAACEWLVTQKFMEGGYN